jgi:hypothetical protein
MRTDEEAMRRAREEEAAKRAADRLKEAYAELQATDKAHEMREQDLLRLEMQVRRGLPSLVPALSRNHPLPFTCTFLKLQLSFFTKCGLGPELLVRD